MDFTYFCVLDNIHGLLQLATIRIYLNVRVHDR